MAANPQFPAWYESTRPPTAGTPATASPPWQGLPPPRRCCSTTWRFSPPRRPSITRSSSGKGRDALLSVTQPPFLDSSGNPVSGFKYRPQDEYLEWAVERGTTTMSSANSGSPARDPSTGSSSPRTTRTSWSRSMPRSWACPPPRSIRPSSSSARISPTSSRSRTTRRRPSRKASTTRSTN